MSNRVIWVQRRYLQHKGILLILWNFYFSFCTSLCEVSLSWFSCITQGNLVPIAHTFVHQQQRSLCRWQEITGSGDEIAHRVMFPKLSDRSDIWRGWLVFVWKRALTYTPISKTMLEKIVVYRTRLRMKITWPEELWVFNDDEKSFELNQWYFCNLLVVKIFDGW